MARISVCASVIVAFVAFMIANDTSQVAAAIPICDIHNQMTIWFLDYADSDATLSHPLGVASGKIEIKESEWQSKCRADGPTTKIFVPFNATSGLEKGQWDTRWPSDVYRTKAEAQQALKRQL